MQNSNKRIENHTSHRTLHTSQKGITLIALIITIIVMLILVGVTINVALNGGLFIKAEEAKTQTQLVADKEELQIAAVAALNGDLEIPNADAIKLEGWTITGTAGGPYTCTSPKENVFTVDKKGNITEGNNGAGDIDFEAIKQDVIANPETYLAKAKEVGQDIEALTDIGIGTDGNVVNLSNWNYGFEDNTVIILGGSLRGAYTGPIEGGKIKGTVPGVIYSDGKVYNVTKMIYVFSGVYDLEICPDIPNTVTDISYLCYSNSYSGNEMKLKTVPVIHANITSANCTFYGCNNISGTIIINAINLENYDRMLSGVGNSTNQITLKGTSSQLEEIRTTGNSEYITIEQ